MKERHAQVPVAWRITLKSGNDPEGFSSVHYHGTNAIADYRVIDPDAVSEPLYLNQENDEIQRQRDELLAALELAQWVDFDDSDYGTVTFCPVCRNDKKYGHYDGCQMASAIASAKGGAA